MSNTNDPQTIKSMKDVYAIHAHRIGRAKYAPAMFEALLGLRHWEIQRLELSSVVLKSTLDPACGLRLAVETDGISSIQSTECKDLRVVTCANSWLLTNLGTIKSQDSDESIPRITQADIDSMKQFSTRQVKRAQHMTKIFSILGDIQAPLPSHVGASHIEYGSCFISVDHRTQDRLIFSHDHYRDQISVDAPYADLRTWVQSMLRLEFSAQNASK